MKEKLLLVNAFSNTVWQIQFASLRRSFNLKSTQEYEHKFDAIPVVLSQLFAKFCNRGEDYVGGKKRGFCYQISQEPFSHVQKPVHISLEVGLLSAFFRCEH